MLLYIFTGYVTYLLNTGESGVGHIQQITHFHITQLQNVYSCVIGFNSNNIHTKQFCGKKPWDYVKYYLLAVPHHLPMSSYTTFPCARFHYL